MEEQKQLLAYQANQNETLPQQIEELRAERRAEMTEIRAEITEMRTEITELREIIQIQRPAIQATSSTSPSYAEVTRTPPESQPSTLQSLSSMNTTPSNMTDTLYCTVDTSRVEEGDKSKA
jgi:peptidoglycan hydrolase CwlO-like protein